MATAIPIHTPDDPASVTLDDARLTINNLVITGTAVIVARQHHDAGGDLETFVRQMIDTGAMITQHGASQATVDAVTTQISRLIDTVNAITAEQLPSAIEKQLKVIRGVLGEHFDPTQADSIQQQLKVEFTAQSAEQNKALREAMLDGTGPLGIVKAELAGLLKTVIAAQNDSGKQLAAITTQLTAAERLKEEHWRGTAHGLDYEAQVGCALAWVHAPHGDTVMPVGNELGAERSRAGDHVVMLNPDVTRGHELRIAVEVKAQPLGIKAALAELDRAMANRDAQAGVLVFASANLAPLDGHSLRTYGGNRFVVVYDRDDEDRVALEAACHLARSFALADIVDDEDQINAERIAEQLQRLNAVLDETRGIAYGVTAARKGIDKVEITYEAMRTKVTAIVREIGESLT